MTQILQYKNLFDKQNRKYEIVKNKIYFLYNGVIVPFGPVVEDYCLEKDEAKKLFYLLNGKLIRLTENIKQNSSKEWYAVVCKKFIPVEDLKSKYRYEINKGLKNCTIERIDPNYLGKYGYEIYIEANKGYSNTNSNVISKDRFNEDCLTTNGFEDIVHHWGVFNDNKLIAYASNYIFDKIEVNYTTVKLRPKYLNLYPSYALFYKMNKFYLSDNSFEYVNDGFRSILHQTKIQDYLIKKFGFEKYYVRLNVKYKEPYNTFIKSTYPLKSLLGRLNGKFEALYKLEQIRKSYL